MDVGGFVHTSDLFRFFGIFGYGDRIGKNVWIGANVTILKDSVIGDNCVVGAGSVVKGKYRENTVIAGNPAVEKKVIE